MTNEPPRITQFQETSALYAVLEGDDLRAQKIVNDMYPNERAEFATQLDRLRAMLTDRFGNDIASGGTSRVRVLDDEGRFIRRPTHEADDPEFTPGSGQIV